MILSVILNLTADCIKGQEVVEVVARLCKGRCEGHEHFSSGCCFSVVRSEPSAEGIFTV